MQLNVPFLKQSTALDCGPTSLRMVLAHFDCMLDKNTVERLIGVKEGKGISTIKLAIAAAKLQFQVDFFSTTLFLNEQHTQHQFYQQYSDMDKTECEQLLAEAKNTGVGLHEQSIPLHLILAHISERRLAIVLLDWNHVLGHPEKGYQGHFVPIVGWDQENVIVHNPSHTTPAELMVIPKTVFESARTAAGTDQDTIFIAQKR